MQEQFLSIEAAAARLNCSSRTLLRAINLGELRAVYVGRLLRIAPADLETYLRRPRAVS